MKFKKTHNSITESEKAPPHQKCVPYTSASITFYVGLTHTHTHTKILYLLVFHLDNFLKPSFLGLFYSSSR